MFSRASLGSFVLSEVYLYFTRNSIKKLFQSLISKYVLDILSIKSTDKPSEAYIITKLYTRLWTKIRTFAVNNAANNVDNNAVNNERAADQGWLPASRLQF